MGRRGFFSFTQYSRGSDGAGVEILPDSRGWGGEGMETHPWVGELLFIYPLLPGLGWGPKCSHGDPMDPQSGPLEAPRGPMGSHGDPTTDIFNYPSVTLTRVFPSLGLEFLGVFNLASVVYHLRPGQLVSDFRFQVSYFRFQIPDSRFQIPDFGFVAASALLRGLAGFRFQISDFRF